jgi:hypothetical protein
MFFFYLVLVAIKYSIGLIALRNSQLEYIKSGVIEQGETPQEV